MLQVGLVYLGLLTGEFGRDCRQGWYSLRPLRFSLIVKLREAGRQAIHGLAAGDVHPCPPPCGPFSLRLPGFSRCSLRQTQPSVSMELS